MTIHQFDFQFYPLRLWIVTEPEESLNEDFKFYYEKYKSQNPFEGGANAVAITTSIVENRETGLRGILIQIFEKESMNASHMAHEACHVSNEVYDYIGQDKVELGDETHAYFVGWIANCIETVLINE